MPKYKSELTPLQVKFIEEYMLDLNATKALQRAGYKGKDPSNRIAAFMNKPNIKEALEARLKERAKVAAKNAQDVVNELIKVAFSNITDAVEIKDGRIKVKNTANWEDATKAFVSEIKESDKGAISIKTHDKVKSLELLGKHFGMWKEKDAESNRAGADAAIFAGLQTVFSKLAEK